MKLMLFDYADWFITHANPGVPEICVEKKIRTVAWNNSITL